MHQIVAQTGNPRQSDRLRPPVQHRLGADIDQDATDLGALKLAADLWRALQDDDLGVRALLMQTSGRSEAGNAGTDYDDNRSWHHSRLRMSPERDPNGPMLRRTAMKISRVVLIVPAFGLIAACGAAAETTAASVPGSASVTSAGTVQSAPVPGPASADLQKFSADAATGGGVGSGPTATGAAAAESKAVISKGQISLRTGNIDRARFALTQLRTSLGGTIDSEDSTADKYGRTDQQHLQIRVPSDKFGIAMDALSHLGILVDRTRTTQDVTTQVIDNNTRVLTQKLSLARIQALLAQAKDLNQVIAIESQLSQRQADLDSLEQQQKYLADQTSQATIDVYLSVPGKHPAAAPGHENSFLAGIHSGWRNLGHATANILEAIGTVLPFGMLIGVVGLPLWVARRRRALT
jgi:hypothetical protein